MIFFKAMFLFSLTALLLFSLHAKAEAIELCQKEADSLMRKAGISQQQIDRVCQLVKNTSAPFTISLKRSEEELGYCRVTLALRNSSADYLNFLTLTSFKGRFEIFNFNNILPGTIGYASAKSRVLLACDELGEVKIQFHWPATIRVGDRSLQGRRRERYKPVLESNVLLWTQ